MLKALVIKELRESVGIVALAALALVYALTEMTGARILPWHESRISSFPFVYDMTNTYLAFFVGGLAIALGLKQTAWEERQGTFFFLLHRPVNRRRVFVGKLAVGIAWTLMLSAIFILLYAWWAATPGHIAAPFEWSMTVPAWKAWAAMPVLYLGAFLSGVRPARWWGTRLAPLAAGILATIVAASMPWFWLTLLLSAVFSALLVIAIFHYMRVRDY
jgi:hypothetical protein